MIESLSIQSLGVIADASLDLRPGLTVVTGETGAGKTMFVSALNLLTGARAESHMVRAGSDRAVVEGIFSATGHPEVISRVEDAGGAADGAEVVLTRTVPASGRARATAGGRTVPAAVLADVGEHLVSMHGQTEQLTLRHASKQRELLDTYGAQPVVQALERYRRAYKEFTDLTARAQDLTASQAQRDARIAFIETALTRIDEVRPTAGEDVELKALALKLEAADDLKRTVESAYNLLVSDSVSELPTAATLLNEAAQLVGRASASDPELAEHHAALTSAALAVSEAASDLSSYVSGFAELDEVSLEDINERRAALASLEAYGPDVAAVLEFERNAGAELLDLEAHREALAGIDDAVAAAQEKLDAAATDLTAARQSAAEDFARAVQAELAALAMPNARVLFNIDPAEPGPHGADVIRMLFSAHRGSEPGEIGKLASGGELSRIMLAIEVVKADRFAFPTFVFDEVDAGVGGAAATEIGRRLAMLARKSQVIVVTHLAQVAAWADTHVVIRKDDSAHAGAVSGVSELADNQREAELARMLGGVSESDFARAHAGELMDYATGQKERFDH